MNHYIIIGIICIISGILCAQADVPLAWSGRKGDAVDAKAVGRISPWWTEVRESHFDLSFLLSCIRAMGIVLSRSRYTSALMLLSLQLLLTAKNMTKRKRLRNCDVTQPYLQIT